MTLKRERLAKVLPSSKTKVQAGRLAGYVGSDQSVVTSVNRALKDTETQLAVQAETQSLAEKTGVTPEWALTHLRANVERSASKREYQPHAINKGVELAMRFHRMLGDEKEQPVPSPVIQQVVNLFGDEAIRQAVEALQRLQEERAKERQSG